MTKFDYDTDSELSARYNERIFAAASLLVARMEALEEAKVLMAELVRRADDHHVELTDPNGQRVVLYKGKIVEGTPPKDMQP